MTYTSPTAATALGTLTVTKYNNEVKGNIEHLYNAGTATQGSVVAIDASLGSALGTVTNIVNQLIGTAITTAATAGSVYTLVTSDSGKLLMCAGTASGTVQIPINSSQAFAVGQKVDLVQMGTGTVTVVGTAGVTLRSTPSAILRTQYSAASVIKIGTNEWLLMGDLF
jgi:hypothetical protein